MPRPLSPGRGSPSSSPSRPTRVGEAGAERQLAASPYSRGGSGRATSPSRQRLGSRGAIIGPKDPLGNPFRSPAKGPGRAAGGGAAPRDAAAARMMALAEAAEGGDLIGLVDSASSEIASLGQTLRAEREERTRLLEEKGRVEDELGMLRCGPATATATIPPIIRHNQVPGLLAPASQGVQGHPLSPIRRM